MFKVSIIGGGISGLYTASLLIDKFGDEIQIDIYESGDKKINPYSQELNFNYSVKGDLFFGQLNGNYRVLGGNSLRWGGQLIKNSVSDFNSRCDHRFSEWPLAYDSIYQFSNDVFSSLGINDSYVLPHINILSKNLKYKNFNVSVWPNYKNRNFSNLFSIIAVEICNL